MAIYQANLMLSEVPIPHLRMPNGWQTIKVVDCGQTLTPLSRLDQNRIAVESQYYMAGYSSAMKECYARESIGYMLLKASEELPPGWKFVIFDAWRPLELQQQLFDNYKMKLRNRHPDIDEDNLNQKVQKYVSLPSSDLLNPSPHLTGGAVDLSLKDEFGKNVDMGTDFDAFDEQSHTCYYELKLEQEGTLNAQEEVYLKNRRILFHTLTKVGFTNYPEEWWHFDYGNQFWGHIKGVEAIYGIPSLSSRRWSVQP